MNVEVLAPAGNIESFHVALNNGADAIYLGMQQFNARAKANNFDEENLKKCVDKAHLFGVKVYLTVNTLLNNEEILEFIKLVKQAIHCNVDAFIVQDLGAAYLLRKYFKNIVLHASTQMGVHNLEGALVLEKLGFKRVVLSRETSLEDIKLIHQKTNLEIEYFVHGALCVAFSGNCYFSSLKHNKSGNRGECLQLCRLKYAALQDNQLLKKGYLLSPTDLCLLSNLKTLIDSGVMSFKIEGRLKRPSYIAQTVKSYKNAIQNLNSIDIQKEQDKLKKIFNRGEFNNGKYLYSLKSNIINAEFPNHRGKLIGSVLKVEKFKTIYKIFISSKIELSTGSGLKFISDKYELSLGIGNFEKLNNSNYIIYSNVKPLVGNDVYLTLDKNFEDSLIVEEKKLKINANFTAKINEYPVLNLKFNQFEINYIGDKKLEEAKTVSVSTDTVIQSLSKLKDTCFEINQISLNVQKIFIPISYLNEIRRQAIILLQNKILSSYNCNIEYEEDLEQVIEKELQSLHKDSYLKQNFVIVNEFTTLNENLENLIFSPTNYSLSLMDQFIEKLNKVKNKFKNILLNIPPILTKKDANVIYKILDEKNIFNGIYINNISGVQFAKKNLIVVSSYMLNITNFFALKQLKQLGVNYISNSIESFSSKVSNLSFSGYPELMQFCHCPYQVAFDCTCENCKAHKNLTYKSEDNKIYQIKKLKIANCYFQLLNSEKIISNDEDIIVDGR